MSTAPRVCVVGSSNMDLISRVSRLPRFGETLTGRSFHMGHGGKGANQAVMAARLGARVTMVTRVGKDVFGASTRRNYRGENIDTTYVMDDDRFSGVATILVDDTAKNFIVVIPGANSGLSPKDVRRSASAIQRADALICQLEVPIEATLEAFRLAKAARVRTILNPAPAAPLPDELLRLSDVCVPNETEAETLTGQTVTSEEEAVAAARALRNRGAAVVILTLGERGAVLVENQSAEIVPAFRVAAVDPTGAGDAFIGSLAVFLGEGLAMREAVRRANAVAALSVERVGAQASFPTQSLVEAFFLEHGLT